LPHPQIRLLPIARVGAIISPAKTDAESIISPALSSLIQYVQPLSCGHKHWPRLSVSVPLAVGMDTVAPEQLPNLGRSLTGRQSGQAAPQASNYHWIAAWQVFSTACSDRNISPILHSIWCPLL